MAYIGQSPVDTFSPVPSKDSFTGDGSTTTFDLQNAVVNGGENALEVFVNNVRQEPGSGKAFTLGPDGSNAIKRITFSAAPASGAAIYVINDKTSNTSIIRPTDLNGTEFILDADADTSLTADTDDRIDIKLANTDHISFGTSSGDTVIKPMTDAKDIIFQQYDGNKVLEINDGGFVGVGGNSNAAGEIRIYEDTDDGSHYVGFKAGNNTASVSYVLPTADGTSGYQLTTDGSGTLSWAAAQITLANDGNNRIVTGTGSSSLNAEANATFDGSTLAITGAATISTNLDVDGTTNLDVVDIDGAVDMASTLTLAGNADFNGDLDVDGTTNLDVVDIDGAVDMASTLTLAGNADFNGDLDVDGTTNLDAVDIDGAVDMATTLTLAGNADFNGDLDVDGHTEVDDLNVSGVCTAATFSGNLPTTDLTGTITNAQLAGSIADSKLNTITTAGKVGLAALEIDGGTDIGADLVDADLFIVDDGAGGTNRKTTGTRIKKYIWSSASGDATASDSGAVTLANSGVTAGSYTVSSITVDAKGRVTSASSGSAGVASTDNITTSTPAEFLQINVSGIASVASLDISGDTDVDGTLEADAITVNGTALNTVIADEATALAIALG